MAIIAGTGMEVEVTTIEENAVGGADRRPAAAIEIVKGTAND